MLDGITVPMNAMLLRLADAVAHAEDLETLSRPLLEMLGEITGFESVYLTALGPQATNQYVLYALNHGELKISEGMNVPWGDTLCQRALAQGVRHTQDVPGLWGDSDAARALGLKSYASVPVEVAGKLHGTLCASSRHSLPLAPEAERLMLLFARLIGRQIEHEALLAELSRNAVWLAQAAFTDALTGLPNRRALLAELGQALARVDRETVGLHLAYIDLDQFKTINDRYGHAVGDRFLKAVAERLKAALRAGDFVARYGGDEFIVLAAAAAEDPPEPLGQRLEQALAGEYWLDGCALDYAGASVGIVRANPGEGPAELLERADQAMYRIKRQRRAVEPQSGRESRPELLSCD